MRELLCPIQGITTSHARTHKDRPSPRHPPPSYPHDQSIRARGLRPAAKPGHKPQILLVRQYSLDHQSPYTTAVKGTIQLG